MSSNTKRVPVYTSTGKKTSTTVRVRNDDTVYKQDRNKFENGGGGWKPAPKQVPKEHRVHRKTPARNRKK